MQILKISIHHCLTMMEYIYLLLEMTLLCMQCKVHWNNLYSLLTTWFFLLIYEILLYIGHYNYLID
jgi:hypothetical protein